MKLPIAHGRSVEEWRGKTPDAKVPPHVRLRIFDRHNGVCHLTGRKIRAGEPWDLDHVVALVNGGGHRETNLAPALRDKHREKTAADVAHKSKVYETRAKHLGLKKPSRLSSSRYRKTMSGVVIDRRTGEEVRKGR